MQIPPIKFRHPEAPDAAVPLLMVTVALAGIWVSAMLSTENASVYAAPFILSAAAIAAAVFAAAAARRPWAVAAILIFVIFGLSLSFRMREHGEVGIDLQNGVKLLTWLALSAIALFNLRLLAPMLKEPTIALACLYAAIALMSVLWSLDPLYSGANAIGWFSYLALACLAVLTLGSERVLRLIVGTLAAFLLLGLVGGVLTDAAWMEPSVEETGFRLRGFSGHPNVFGQQAGLLVTLTIIARRQALLPRLWFVCALVIGILAVVLSGSRTTLAAVLVAAMIIEFRERGLLAPAVGATIMLVSAALLLFSFIDLHQLEGAMSGLSRTGSGGEILTLTGRTEIWSIALERFGERPLFGWGFNAAERLLLDSMPPTFYGDAVNTHNMFLQSLLTVGFIGSLPGFSIIAILLLRFFARPDATRDHMLVFLLVLGLGEAEFFSTPMLMTLFIFIMLAREAAGNAAPSGARGGYRRFDHGY